MDFAKKYGFDGVLVEGWIQGWDGDCELVVHRCETLSVYGGAETMVRLAHVAAVGMRSARDQVGVRRPGQRPGVGTR